MLPIDKTRWILLCSRCLLLLPCTIACEKWFFVVVGWRKLGIFVLAFNFWCCCYPLQALEFGRKVEVLCRQNEHDLMALESRRKRNVAAAAALRDDLLRSFGELEAVVHAGREDILREQERQQVCTQSTAI
jgi:hypothetical protein